MAVNNDPIQIIAPFPDNDCCFGSIQLAIIFNIYIILCLKPLSSTQPFGYNDIEG